MISSEENDRLTRVGAGTPAGAVLRRSWQPAALAEELPADRPVIPVTLMGEQLVLFRSESGALGLMERHCPHRGVDLSYGRVEDGGLRCPFHGWLFDIKGRCLARPAEPDGRGLGDRSIARSYPCVERAGIIWAYLGEGEAPAFPDIDCFNAPDSHTFAFKGLWACNWLQALEVGIDPAHAAFLHRFQRDEDVSGAYGKQFRDRGAADTDLPMTKLLREFPRPKIVVEETKYGLRLKAIRDAGSYGVHVRVTNQLFPNAICIPMSPTMVITQWHVPVDDTSCYWYAVFTSYTDPVDKKLMREQRIVACNMPDYAPKLGAHNRYGFSATEQREETYTGMGADINVHDQWAVESPGRITDRTREHLGKSDIGIVTYRRMLLNAMKLLEQNPGAALPQNMSDAPTMTAIDCLLPVGADVEGWTAAERKRRRAAPWTDKAA